MIGRWGLVAVAAGVALVAARPASAGSGVTVTPDNPSGPDLGKVAQSPTTSSVWRIDADTGEVSLVSGEAVRLTSGPASPPMITISCPVEKCRNALVTVSLAPGGPGRASIVGFRPGTVSAHGLTLQSVSGAGTRQVVMTFLAGAALPATAAFALGMDVSLAPGRDSFGSLSSYVLTVAVH